MKCNPDVAWSCEKCVTFCVVKMILLLYFDLSISFIVHFVMVILNGNIGQNSYLRQELSTIKICQNPQLDWFNIVWLHISYPNWNPVELYGVSCDTFPMYSLFLMHFQIVLIVFFYRLLKQFGHLLGKA